MFGEKNSAVVQFG